MSAARRIEVRLTRAEYDTLVAAVEVADAHWRTQLQGYRHANVAARAIESIRTGWEHESRMVTP